MSTLNLIRSLALGAAIVCAAEQSAAQQTISREDAQRISLAQGGRVALARADSAAAFARLVTARALPNPTLAASYSKATPQKHLALEIPLFDALYTRGAKIAQAEAAARAARQLYASERIAAIVETDTTYTRTLAVAAKARLSRAAANDADSLLVFAIRRRDAGDASDLDVDLAYITSRQLRNVATEDSLVFMSTTLVLQTLLGIPADSVSLFLRDTLVLASADTAAMLFANNANVNGVPTVVAAEASLQAAELGITTQLRSRFLLPSLSVGVEFGDPSGSEPGLLPTIGFSLPLPLFNRNEGPIAEAKADRDRARIVLLQTRLDARRRVLEGIRERSALLAKLQRDADLNARAARVAARSLTAYREGASTLANVLEAQRSVREVLGQYAEDLSALLIVNAELRGLTQTVPVP